MFFPCVEILYIDVPVIITCGIVQIILPDSNLASDMLLGYIHGRVLWAYPVCNYQNYLGYVGSPLEHLPYILGIAV